MNFINARDRFIYVARGQILDCHSLLLPSPLLASTRVQLAMRVTQILCESELHAI